MKKCFPVGHPLRKGLNLNSVKGSYSCLPNMKTLVNGYNKKKLSLVDDNVVGNINCNCKGSTKCEVNGNCLEKDIIYSAKVTQTDNNNVNTYLGQTGGTFKTRLIGHRSNIKLIDYRLCTSLSKHVWELKDEGQEYNIDWTIVQKAKSYKPGGRGCVLCSTETYFILFNKSLSSLNTRNELYNPCPHRDRWKIYKYYYFILSFLISVMNLLFIIC